MEAAFHPLFNMAVGTCRLDYRRQENRYAATLTLTLCMQKKSTIFSVTCFLLPRAFFIALFRHLTFVGSRACHRTALEFCKLLYSLDPEADPVGVLLLVDFYAIRAQQYKW